MPADQKKFRAIPFIKYSGPNNLLSIYVQKLCDHLAEFYTQTERKFYFYFILK